jgi:hypothetical protein
MFGLWRKNLQAETGGGTGSLANFAAEYSAEGLFTHARDSDSEAQREGCGTGETAAVATENRKAVRGVTSLLGKTAWWARC